MRRSPIWCRSRTRSATSSHLDVYRQDRAQTQAAKKVNANGTSGYVPSVVGGTDSIIKLQTTSSTSDLSLFNLERSCLLSEWDCLQGNGDVYRVRPLSGVDP